MATYQSDHKTNFPPPDKPLLVWDGECGFCRYWVQKWERYFGDKLNYEPYQQAAARFPDIPRENFKGAVQLIETDGRIFPGAATVFHSLCVGRNVCWPEEWYRQSDSFRKVSDVGYQWVSENRSFLFKVTTAFFGKDPGRTKPYWLLYAGLVAAGITGIALARRNR